MPGAFLTAEWRKLAMANYVIDPVILQPYLPFKTEIDLWNGACYVSLVGFMFLNTRLKGIKIPFHSNFEEVNLRFYVRYRKDNEWKRGVVFVKEIVPKPALTFVANDIYQEKYETMSMSHEWKTEDKLLNVSYSWKKSQWHKLSVWGSDEAVDIELNSEEEFITEHFWGYTRINNQTTSEYGVEHPRWKVYPINRYDIQVNFGLLYGSSFSFLNEMKPTSVFLAEGSSIVVKSGTRIS